MTRRTLPGADSRTEDEIHDVLGWLNEHLRVERLGRLFATWIRLGHAEPETRRKRIESQDPLDAEHRASSPMSLGGHA